MIDVKYDSNNNVVASYSDNMKATVIKHSTTNGDVPIATLVLEYPRMVHCFDEKTEVLSQFHEETPLFRPFAAVNSLRLKVAQYDPSNEEVSFVIPDSYVENKGNHSMVRYTGNSKKFSMFTTDEHRIFTTKRTTDNAYLPNTVLAKDLLTQDWGSRRIPQAGYLQSEQTLSTPEIQLVAWFVADGHMPKKGNKASFHFRKQRKVKSVCDILDACGLTYSVTVYGEDTVIRFDAPRWVEQCYDENGGKCYPDIATRMSQETYNQWKQALFESDGNVDNREYNTYSSVVAEQVQSVAITHGDAVNMTKYGSCYKLKFHKSNYISIRCDKDSFESEVYNGMVYCVSVPSSYILVRREGKPYVSGNCEFMTHRVFSRNASSSRAIPIKDVINQVKNNPAMPVHWGANQSGMQAKHQLNGWRLSAAKLAWKGASRVAIASARVMNWIGMHKQLVNRVLEPFQTIKVVMTATELDNFFYLRCHSDAQPEINMIAECAYRAIEASMPEKLENGEWHLPFVKSMRENGKQVFYTTNVITEHVGRGFKVIHQRIPLSLEDAIALSASLCAQVSYRKSDESLEKAMKIYTQLVTMKPVHASPFEHQATPMSPLVDWSNGANCDGVTHQDRHGKFWSGNFRGWIQNRQLIKDNVCSVYERGE